jgi:potassium/hydrogen antiporter
MQRRSGIRAVERELRCGHEDGGGRACAGDWLLIVASAAVREQTERWLRAVSRADKLAGWFGEHGL